MDKIVEELFARLIERLDKIDSRIDTIERHIKDREFAEQKRDYDSKNNSKEIRGSSSDGQLNYIRQLGGKPDNSMSKQQASDEIDRLLRLKQEKALDREKEKSHEVIYQKKFDKPIEIEKVNEPVEVDTDEAGVDEDGLI